MSRRCELTGKGPMVGNNISHANNEIKRWLPPNQSETALASETPGRTFRLKVSATALRTVDHKCGLDAHLMEAKDAELSDEARCKTDIPSAQPAT